MFHAAISLTWRSSFHDGSMACIGGIHGTGSARLVHDLLHVQVRECPCRRSATERQLLLMILVKVVSKLGKLPCAVDGIVYSP